MPPAMCFKYLEDSLPDVLHSQEQILISVGQVTTLSIQTPTLLIALLRQCNLPAFSTTAMKNQLPIKLNTIFIKNSCHLELNPVAVKYKRGFQADFP